MDAAQTVKITVDSAVSDLLHLAAAYILAVPVGWNRERVLHTAGIRTFPIVGMASCGLAIVALSIPNADPGTFSRVLQGLVTGIGFVGAGAIVRGRGSVSSAATAASIWCIGIAGAAVGLKAYHIAIALSVANFLTLQLLAPLKRELDTTNSKRPAE